MVKLQERKCEKALSNLTVLCWAMFIAARDCASWLWLVQALAPCPPPHTQISRGSSSLEDILPLFPSPCLFASPSCMASCFLFFLHLSLNQASGKHFRNFLLSSNRGGVSFEGKKNTFFMKPGEAEKLSGMWFLRLVKLSKVKIWPGLTRPLREQDI